VFSLIVIIVLILVIAHYRAIKKNTDEAVITIMNESELQTYHHKAEESTWVGTFVAWTIISIVALMMIMAFGLGSVE